MENIMFSEVKREHGLMQFLWPVQSFAQVKTMALIYAFGLPLVTLLVYLMGDPDFICVTLIGASLGGTGSLFLHLPGTLKLTTKGEARHFVGEVSELLERYGYCDSERVGGRLHFVGRWPKWWPQWVPRYFRWKEAEIYLSVHDHTITLCGPKFMLRILKRRGEQNAQRGLYHA